MIERLTPWNLTSTALLILAALAINPGTAAAQRGGTALSPNSAPYFWFKQYCASCHGIDGTGNGPVASSLKTPPADLTVLSQNHGGVFPEQEVRDVVDGRRIVAAHGSREMPVWGYPTTFQQGTLSGFFKPALTREEINDRIRLIVSYVKAIQKK